MGQKRRRGHERQGRGSRVKVEGKGKGKGKGEGEGVSIEVKVKVEGEGMSIEVEVEEEEEGSMCVRAEGEGEDRRWRVDVAEVGSTGSGSVRVLFRAGHCTHFGGGNKMKNAPQCHVEWINMAMRHFFLSFFSICNSCPPHSAEPPNPSPMLMPSHIQLCPRHATGKQVHDNTSRSISLITDVLAHMPMLSPHTPMLPPHMPLLTPTPFAHLHALAPTHTPMPHTPACALYPCPRPCSMPTPHAL